MSQTSLFEPKTIVTREWRLTSEFEAKSSPLYQKNRRVTEELPKLSFKRTRPNFLLSILTISGFSDIAAQSIPNNGLFGEKTKPPFWKAFFSSSGSIFEKNNAKSPSEKGFPSMKAFWKKVKIFSSILGLTEIFFSRENSKLHFAKAFSERKV